MQIAAVLGYTFAQLARLQVELEYDLTPDGLLEPRADSSERSRCVFYVHAEGLEAYFSAEVPPDLRRLIAAAPDATSVPGAAVKRFETYVAAEPFPASAYPPAQVEGREAHVAEAGQIVSRAWSVRESDRAAECAVETVERLRRRGYGAQATAAWVNRVLADGKVPFYSHEAGNEPSRALARRLGLLHVFSVVEAQ